MSFFSWASKKNYPIIQRKVSPANICSIFFSFRHRSLSKQSTTHGEKINWLFHFLTLIINIEIIHSPCRWSLLFAIPSTPPLPSPFPYFISSPAKLFRYLRRKILRFIWFLQFFKVSILEFSLLYACSSLCFSICLYFSSIFQKVIDWEK